MNHLEQEKNERIEDSITKDIRILFRVKRGIKEIDDTTIKDTRNYLRLKKKKKQLKIE